MHTAGILDSIQLPLDSKDIDYVTMPQRRILELCENYAISCLDLYRPFAEQHAKGVPLYKDKIHLTDAGHDLVTSRVIDIIAEIEAGPNPLF